METVHCMSLSSIHIHYNHDPVQAQVGIPMHTARVHAIGNPLLQYPPAEQRSARLGSRVARRGRRPRSAPCSPVRIAMLITRGAAAHRHLNQPTSSLAACKRLFGNYWYVE